MYGSALCGAMANLAESEHHPIDLDAIAKGKLAVVPADPPQILANRADRPRTRPRNANALHAKFLLLIHGKR